jgi:hypothetical protein
MHIRKSVKEALNDVKDTLHETEHRAMAGVERAKRALTGKRMSGVQRMMSHFMEVGHKTAAEVDKAKRELRHNT